MFRSADTCGSDSGRVGTRTVPRWVPPGRFEVAQWRDSALRPKKCLGRTDYAPILNGVGSVKLAAIRDAQRRTERGSEERTSPSLAVVATCLGNGVPIAGVADDISRSGLSMLMPQRPMAVHQDVTVQDGDISVELWVRVVDCVAADDDTFVWHVHVVTAEDGWSVVVDRIDD